MNKKISIKHLVKLTNLIITPQEEKIIDPQLEETLTYFDILNEIPNLTKTQPTFQVTANENITHPDQIEPSLIRIKILKNKKYFTTKL